MKNKLTEEERENMRTLHKNGESIRSIARHYEGKCSRRLIQLTLFPARMEKVKADNRANMKKKRLLIKTNKK